MMNAERITFFQAFLDEYIKIRLAEGRGSESAEYYRNLPDCEPGHPIAWQWRLRQRTFAKLCSAVLPRLAPHARILDLGAGVGWLSYRLRHREYQICSVDLCLDERDGLLAARHYLPDWPRVQAEFDRLPFPDSSVDAVIFNASFHYSTDYVRTLRETLRVLRREGMVVILESPIYRRDASGRQMVDERHQDFERRFGTRSDSLGSIQFLTWHRIARLGEDLHVNWSLVRPWYGWKWALRPFKAWLKRQREPSRFVILIGRQDPLSDSDACRHHVPRRQAMRDRNTFRS